MQAFELVNNLQLERYPKSTDASLTAFNQAEVLLISRVLEEFNDSSLSTINENFGALSCCLHDQVIEQYNDSFLSNFAFQQNIARNNLSSKINKVSDPANLTGDLIIGLLPKSLSFWKWQLEKLNQLNKPVLISGMVKYISKGHIDLMNQYFEDIQVSRAHKKARSVLLNKPRVKLPSSTNPTHDFQGIKIENLPGVFCQKHIDIGARFFIEQFKKIAIKENDQIADLGCGNGILSLALSKLNKNKKMNIDSFDESNQAVACAKHNWQLNGFDQNIHDVQFIQNDGLLDQPQNKFDVILCNPPFHQNQTVGTHITISLIKQAKNCLKENGEFWVVANRQLPYLKELKSHFSQVDLVAQNAKFKVFKASI